MIFKDTKGKYTIKLDTKRRIATEIMVGAFETEDVQRFTEDYKRLVGEHFNKNGIKPWSKLADIREYRTSNVVEAINEHAHWAITNGMTHTASIVSKVVDGMQMKRSVKGTAIKLEYFTSEEDGLKWLESQGF